jgi:hypothetical protein
MLNTSIYSFIDLKRFFRLKLIFSSNYSNSCNNFVKKLFFSNAFIWYEKNQNLIECGTYYMQDFPVLLLKKERFIQS